MASRDELAGQVREELGDLGVTWYSVNDINDSLQDGYNEVAVVAGLIEKTIEIPLVSNLVYYDFSILIPDFFAVTRIFNLRNNKWLLPSSDRSLDSVRSDWELWNGEPNFFFQKNPSLVCIVPSLSSASGAFQVFYRAKAPILEAVSIPIIFLDEQDVLIKYSTADLLEQAHEWNKASNYILQHEEQLLAIRERAKRLGFPDRTLIDHAMEWHHTFEPL